MTNAAMTDAVFSACRDKEHRVRNVKERFRSVSPVLKRILSGDPSAVIRGLRMRMSGLDRTGNRSEPVEWDRTNYCSQKRIAVYVAEFGGYDTVRSPLMFPDNIDYFLVSDRTAAPEGWHLKDPSGILPADVTASAQRNRWCRMHPGLLFPDHDVSIYVDSSTLIASDLTPLANAAQHRPVAMFRHMDRDCVYDEIEACRIKKKAPASMLDAQRGYLRELGVPEHWGLLETPMVVTDLHSPTSAGILQTWWEEYSRYPGRDQISLIACLWKQKISPGEIAALGSDLRNCDLFLRLPHCLSSDETKILHEIFPETMKEG